MDRYKAVNARARILSYYSPEPQEVALKKDREPFERAKAEWLKNARMALEETEVMTFEEWQATREIFKARKPDECFECGQQYRNEAANAGVTGSGEKI